MVHTIFIVTSELQRAADGDIVLEVTLGTIVYVLEDMKSSFRIPGNMSFACNEKCPTCFQSTSHPSFMKVSHSVCLFQL